MLVHVFALRVWPCLTVSSGHAVLGSLLKGRVSRISVCLLFFSALGISFNSPRQPTNLSSVTGFIVRRKKAHETKKFRGRKLSWWVATAKTGKSRMPTGDFLNCVSTAVCAFCIFVIDQVDRRTKWNVPLVGEVNKVTNVTDRDRYTLARVLLKYFHSFPLTSLNPSVFRLRSAPRGRSFAQTFSRAILPRNLPRHLQRVGLLPDLLRRLRR